MYINKKLIFLLSLVLLFSFIATHNCFAKTVEWKDFTRPLNLDSYKLTGPNPLTINVHIPAEVLRKYAKIPLIFKGKGGPYQVNLRINDNFWAVHKFPDEGLPAVYNLNIKTKHLKPGVNKLRFTKDWSGILFIHSLQFNIIKGRENKMVQAQPRKEEQKRTKKIQTQPIPETSKHSSDTIAEKDKFKIAVMEFKSLNPGAKTTNLGSMISEMFTTEVVNNNSFKIVEREQLNKILGELKIGQSGVLDTTDAQKLGKILGARAIITGSVMKMGDSLRIDSRIIEVETGIIVSAERRICKENLTDISWNIADMTAALAKKFYKQR
ncbi:MAG: CsgG/HfaB family protein [Deltaproteobacteria bacterium]|nr:CsgG/HfaB family protein [Deltaproteobacteria bacterium]